MPKLQGSPSPGTDSRTPIRALVILLCVSAIIVTLYSQESATGPIHTIRSYVHTVSAPFEEFGSWIATPLEVLRQALENAQADEETLIELKERNAYLVSQLSILEEYKTLIESYREMLSLIYSDNIVGVSAHVISYSQDSWTSTITINRGSQDGIEVDMAVTDGISLIGQVLSVSPTTSVVRLVSDPSFSVSAMVQGTSSYGVFSGSLDSTLSLDYISVADEVNVGDIVITSGLSDVYPKGLVLGTVASVTSSPSDLYYQIAVSTLSSPYNGSDVLVVTSFDYEEKSNEQVEAEVS